MSADVPAIPSVPAGVDYALEPGRSCLLFDIDGTLTDTDPLHGQAWNEALRAATGATFEVAAYVAACVDGTMNPAEYIRTIVPSVDPERLRDHKDGVYRRLLADVPLRPGFPEFITDLHHHGFPFGIVTGSSRASVTSFLEVRWLGPRPNVVISRGDSEHRKPHPGPYQAALAALSCRPETSIAVEDSPNGIRAAVTCGLHCVRMAAPDQAPDPSTAELVDITVSDFRSFSIRASDTGKVGLKIVSGT